MKSFISALLGAFLLSTPIIANEIQSTPQPEEPQYYFPVCAPQWTPPIGVVLRAAGVTKEGTKMLFFRSDSGRWGLLEVNLDGIMCLLATGKDWIEKNDERNGE